MDILQERRELQLAVGTMKLTKAQLVWFIGAWHKADTGSLTQFNDLFAKPLCLFPKRDGSWGTGVFENPMVWGPCFKSPQAAAIKSIEWLEYTYPKQTSFEYFVFRTLQRCVQTLNEYTPAAVYGSFTSDGGLVFTKTPHLALAELRQLLDEASMNLSQEDRKQHRFTTRNAL